MRSEFLWWSRGGLKLGDRIDTVEEQLSVSQDKYSGIVYGYNGIEFEADPDIGLIETIRISSTEYRTDKGIGLGSTLGDIVKAYGNDKVRNLSGTVLLHLKKTQVIAFSMATYDSIEFTSDTVVRGMEIMERGERFKSDWDSALPLEY